MGFIPNDGFNDDSLFESMWLTSTIDPAAEIPYSSQTAFLNQEIQGSSIQSYSRTLANKILFNYRKRAIGVIVTSSSSAYTLSARKEVILSESLHELWHFALQRAV